MVLDIDRFVADEGAIPHLKRVGLAHGIVVDYRGRDVVDQIAYLGIVGDIGRWYHTHVYHALVLDAVGQILDILRLEEIIATVAHKVGDIDAHGSQRIQAVAATGLQVTI